MSIFTKFKGNLMRHGLEYFKLFYGVYRGKCESNADPDNLGRLQVSCPELYGANKPQYWAHGRGMIAGNAPSGVYWIPSKGDPIYLSTMNGDPRFPLWEYGWWLKGKLPSTATPGNQVFLSTTGHRIELDDNNAKVLVTSKDGFQIELRATGLFLGKDGTFNLGKWLRDLIALNEATLTATAIGAQPFINVIDYGLLKTELDSFLDSS